MLIPVNCGQHADSLSTFLSTASKRRIPPYNPYPRPPISVRQTVNAISDATLTSQDVSDLYDALKDPKKVKVKHFRFKEDLRPGYVGESETVCLHELSDRVADCSRGALLIRMQALGPRLRLWSVRGLPSLATRRS